MTIVPSVKVETIDVDEDEDDDSDVIPYEGNQTSPRYMPPEEITDTDGDFIDLDNFPDQMIGMEVVFDQGEAWRQATGIIISRCIDGNGRPIDIPHQNPKLNSCLYNVKFKDSTTEIISANTIVKKISDQVDINVYSDMLLYSIFDWKFDSKAVKGDGYVIDCNGKRRLRKTTAGVKLKVALRYGDKINKTWLPLKDLKESNLVQVAEISKARGLDTKPAFKWWVNYTLKKRDIIIASITDRLKKLTHIYGIEIPRSIGHGREINKINGNTLWMDVLKI